MAVVTEAEMLMAKNEADLIKEETQKSLFVLDEIDNRMDEIQSSSPIYGKTVDEWHHYFQILVDPTADMIQIKRYCSEIIEKLGQAYRYLNITKKKYATYKVSYEQAFSEEVSKKANSKVRKTIPAADTLSLTARSQLGNRTLMCDSYEMAIDFWQSFVFMLNKQHDAIKMMGMANASMAKAENAFG